MQAEDDRPARSGRIKLLALIAVFALPLAGAVAWYFAAPALAPEPAVHGALIDPARPLQPFSAPRAGQGSAYTLDDLRGRWTLVHVIAQSCDERCRERLYYTRQIREALGEDRIRVQRLVLAPRGADTQGLSALLPEHARLVVVESPADSGLRAQLPADPASGTVFVVDPLGNLMLRFGPQVDPSDILDDIEHLLELSRIG
jgi:cytochrome oxidase Cu insertion factor (SCO1/SenC/PrrC family)